ncbi:hypothetical protein [Actinobacillus pleuropneumoniae]
MQNNTQRYFCNQCHKTFILKNKLAPDSARLLTSTVF